jgi:DNA-binding NarL/FixJ family response regulator
VFSMVTDRLQPTGHEADILGDDVTRTRILVADDHPAVLERMAEMLAAKYEVVGEARDGKSLLELAEQLHPDVLVIDISMPALSGIEAAQQLKQKGTKAIIVFLTVHDDPDFVRAALAAGATGYVTKSRMATDLLPAVEEALAGRRFISPSLVVEDPAGS